MKTPTKHSDEVPIATECLGSSAKIDSKLGDASELMVADMLSQMEEDFRKSGNSIMNRMREVGSKMDALEESIYGLVRDAGLDEEEYSQDLNNSKESAASEASAQKSRTSL